MPQSNTLDNCWNFFSFLLFNTDLVHNARESKIFDYICGQTQAGN